MWMKVCEIFKSVKTKVNYLLVLSVFNYLCSKFLDRRAKERKENTKKQMVIGDSSLQHHLYFETTLVHVFVYVGFGDDESGPVSDTMESETIGISNGSGAVNNSKGGQSFQIKPSKERVKKKKTSACTLF